MVRESLKTKASAKSKLFGFAIINIIPISGAAWFLWALGQGKVSWDDLPAGLGRNGLYLALAIALLFTSVTFLLPTFHFFASRLRAQLRASAEARSSGGVIRLLWECLLWPFRQVLYRVFWIARFAMYFVSLAVIATCVVFLVRFAKPEFAEELLHVDEHTAKFESWVEGLGKD